MKVTKKQIEDWLLHETRLQDTGCDFIFLTYEFHVPVNKQLGKTRTLTIDIPIEEIADHFGCKVEHLEIVD